MKKLILKNLPYKEKKYNNSIKKLEKYDQYCFTFGKIINENIFNKNIGEEKYIKILKYLENKSYDKIIQNDCKHYFYNDLQLIINNFGMLWCKKDKIFSYTNFKDSNNLTDMRLELNRSNIISVDYFPGLDKYFDMKKIQKKRFIKNNISYEMSMKSFRDKSITYEFVIYSNKTKLNNMIHKIIELNNNLKLFDSLKLFNFIKLENYDISKLSKSIK